ncbi:single-stranded DNA-binding protein [Candidatus Pacearchaeota archaeon]|nr:single-stranded DNA-binding protein [Candidatus Pacearchaeota archaeon]
MPSGNIWIGWGHLGNDPEYKTISSGKELQTFSIAKKERGDRNDSWFNITKWEPSEFDKKLRKGDLVLVQGTESQDTWEKDGQKRSAHKVTAFRVDLMRAKAVEQTAMDLPAGAPDDPLPF